MFYTQKIIVKCFNRDSELKIMMTLLQIQVNNIELFITQEWFIDNRFSQAPKSKVNGNKVNDCKVTKAEIEQQSWDTGGKLINLFPLRDLLVIREDGIFPHKATHGYGDIKMENSKIL